MLKVIRKPYETRYANLDLESQEGSLSEPIALDPVVSNSRTSILVGTILGEFFLVDLSAQKDFVAYLDRIARRVEINYREVEANGLSD